MPPEKKCRLIQSLSSRASKAYGVLRWTNTCMKKRPSAASQRRTRANASGQLRWDGTHYARTAEAWLANMERRRPEVWRALQQAHGAEHAGLWWVRWRLFFLSCAELWNFRQGEEWHVSHYLFRRP